MRKFARITRQSLYYRLIDIAFICQLFLVAAWLFKRITGESAVDGLLAYPWAVIAPIGLFLPPLLVFQRWMRDDFSEMLWQRAAGTVLKALVVLPIPIMFITAVAIATRVSIGLDPASDYTPADRPTFGGIPPELAGQLLGHIYSMVSLWAVASLLFIFSFQWHRWRASR